MFDDLECSPLRSGQDQLVIMVVVADKLACEVELQVENLTHFDRIRFLFSLNNNMRLCLQ